MSGRPNRAHSRAHRTRRARARRAAHALERAQRRHVGEREGVLDEVLCEVSREVAHMSVVWPRAVFVSARRALSAVLVVYTHSSMIHYQVRLRSTRHFHSAKQKCGFSVRHLRHFRHVRHQSRGSFRAERADERRERVSSSIPAAR